MFKRQRLLGICLSHPFQNQDRMGHPHLFDWPGLLLFYEVAYYFGGGFEEVAVGLGEGA
jgi:hypothetical protein